MILPKLPTTDWTFIAIEDAMDNNANAYSTCDFCGTEIRWVHVLEHDDYPRPVNAGCCCAQKYCYDYDAEAAEREHKNKIGRLGRFVARDKWRASKNNRENICRFVRLPNGRRIHVTVWKKQDLYGVCITGLEHWDRYRSQLDAMNAAFDLVDDLKRETNR